MTDGEWAGIPEEKLVRPIDPQAPAQITSKHAHPPSIISLQKTAFTNPTLRILCVAEKN